MLTEDGNNVILKSVKRLLNTLNYLPESFDELQILAYNIIRNRDNDMVGMETENPFPLQNKLWKMSGRMAEKSSSCFFEKWQRDKCVLRRWYTSSQESRTAKASMPTQGGILALIPKTADKWNLAVWCDGACGGARYRPVKKAEQPSRITDQREVVLPVPKAAAKWNLAVWCDAAERRHTIPSSRKRGAAKSIAEIPWRFAGMADRREAMPSQRPGAKRSGRGRCKKILLRSSGGAMGFFYISLWAALAVTM